MVTRFDIVRLKDEADAAAAAAGAGNPGAQIEAHVTAIWKALDLIAQELDTSGL